MADEYIRKQDAVRVSLDFAVEYLGGAFDEGLQKGLKNNLESLEPADVVPVVHSKWLYKCGEIQCPECGNRIHRIDLSGCLNFCPNCGAKMDAR